MQTRHLLLSLCLALLLLPMQAQADPISGTGSASFDTGTDVLTVTGTISVGPGTLPGSPFVISLPLAVDDGVQAIFGSVGNPGSIDIQTGKLDADVSFINVAFPGFDAGFNFNTYTLGGIGSESGLTIMGGSEAGFVSSTGTFSILLDQISYPGAANSVFDPVWFTNSFTADAQLQMETAPEPGSFLLVATGLGLMIGARRRRQL